MSKSDLKSDLVRLKHMLDAAKEATTFASGRSRADLDSDRMLTLALVKSIEIIGEAANNVSKAYRDKHHQISWQDIIGMRHRLIHVYFNVNLDVVWKTVTEDLPPLIAELEKIIGSEEAK